MHSFTGASKKKSTSLWISWTHAVSTTFTTESSSMLIYSSTLLTHKKCYWYQLTEWYQEQRSTNLEREDSRLVDTWPRCNNFSSSSAWKIKKTSRVTRFLQAQSSCIPSAPSWKPIFWARWTTTGNTWMLSFRIAQSQDRENRKLCNSSEHASRRTFSLRRPPIAFTLLMPISSCYPYRPD